LVQKFARIKVLNALALLILLHGSENWTLRKKGKKILISIGMRFSEDLLGAPFLTTKVMKKFWKNCK